MSEDKDTIDDGNLKIHQLVDRRGRDSARGKTVGRLFDSTFQSSMKSLEKDPWKDMPMIILKHRWMKNRNLVAGNTIMSFNNEGIAKIRDLGNVRLDVEKVVQRSGGLIVIVDETLQAASEDVLASDPSVPVDPEKDVPGLADEATGLEIVEDEDFVDDGVDPSSQLKRKAPPKRKK